MRQIIPENIKILLKQQAPYLRFVDGVGMMLVPDAPPEIVKIREETLKWFEDHDQN